MADMTLPSTIKERRLPPLREELSLHAGPQAADGSPTWVIEDPLSGRYFRLGWFEFEVVSRWHLGSLKAIAQDICDHTPLQRDAAACEGVLAFLSTHNLLQSRGEQAIQRMREQAGRMKQQWWRWLLKNYLFIRIPLVKPEAFLRATWPMVRWIWSPWFFALALCSGMAGLFLAGRQWDTFLATFPHFFNVQGMVAMALALMFAKVIHELGHAYTARQYGCSVPSMGVAFLVLWPVLYTDTTTAWRLKSNRQRLAISAAGMTAEIMLACFALLAWSLMPDGPARSAVFLLATTTWVLTLAVNLNPLMRFDGYYLLSDYLEMPNLQERAFAYARWQLREWLFGFADHPPELIPKAQGRTVLIYAYATWIYRFFLFLGIALLVYHFFFKALGIFLMLVELVWFIGMPVYKELTEWFKRGRKTVGSPRGKYVFLALTLVCLVLVLPWRNVVKAPAVWKASAQTRIYPKVASQLTAIHVQQGDVVKEGQVLFELSSPDLDFQIEQGRKNLESLAWLVQYRGMNPELLARSRVARSEFEAEYAAQLARLTEKSTLTVVSPHAGTVLDLKPGLRPGDWLPATDALALVVDLEGSRIEAYVDEYDVPRIMLHGRGDFSPSQIEESPFLVSIATIDQASTSHLPEHYLASLWGGEVAVRKNTLGELIPERSIYRIELYPVNQSVFPGAVMSGSVLLDAKAESLLLMWWRRAWGTLVRESGF